MARARFLLLALLLAAVPAGTGAPAPAPRPPEAAARPRAQAEAESLATLRPDDPGFGEAMELADVLQRAGIRIGAVLRSKLVGFLDQPKVASYASDRGPFAVVFLAEPDGAERVRWEARRRGARVRYTYRWTEGGQARTWRETIDAPRHIVQVGPWFILTWSDSTQGALRDALAVPRRGVG